MLQKAEWMEHQMIRTHSWRLVRLAESDSYDLNTDL